MIKFDALNMKVAQENLEELMTSLSFQCDCRQLRILSIESVEQAKIRDDAELSGKVISIDSRRRSKHTAVVVTKELIFNDQSFHS